MEQRPLRLGDIVDDYCPRERRITNHAIVAVVDQVIRQTRCATCDTEHVYKEAKVPRRRKKDETAGDEPVAPRAAAGAADGGAGEAEGLAAHGAVEAMEAMEPVEPMEVEIVEASPADAADDPADADESDEDADRIDEFWSGHRPLIRATLPRSETDEPVPRPIPEFTMHQRPRGAQPFRHGQGHGGDGRNGFRAGHGQGGPHQGQGQGQGRAGRRRGRSGRHRGKRPR